MKKHLTPKRLGLFLCLAVLLSAILPFHQSAVAADPGRTNPYLIGISVDDQDRQIAEVIVPGKPPDVRAAAVAVPEVQAAGVTNSLSNVPAYDWSYGCSPTAAAMLFGYYDRVGYPNIYTGPTNGGVMPLDNSIWGSIRYPGVISWGLPLSASQRGLDGRSTRGHVNDYWRDYLDSNLTHMSGTGQSIQPIHCPILWVPANRSSVTLTVLPPSFTCLAATLSTTSPVGNRAAEMAPTG